MSIDLERLEGLVKPFREVLEDYAPQEDDFELWRDAPELTLGEVRALVNAWPELKALASDNALPSWVGEMLNRRTVVEARIRAAAKRVADGGLQVASQELRDLADALAIPDALRGQVPASSTFADGIEAAAKAVREHARSYQRNYADGGEQMSNEERAVLGALKAVQALSKGAQP